MPLPRSKWSAQTKSPKTIVDVKADKDHCAKFPSHFVMVNRCQGRNHYEFLSLSQELTAPAEFRHSATFDFDFKNVEKAFESYHGPNIFGKGDNLSRAIRCYQGTGHMGMVMRDHSYTALFKWDLNSPRLIET
ncbi:hypothetical protein BASA50_010448 [Batrachochytrium salamandrivorans]|uniref:Uncharacterized protein n=1 Tax=Batrachochytrium salamandrivorans TaxID=1357716 RepID=A0ABQ8F1K2_9FUNG|nr:hypothetical protein BASA50_010448 [Batrachochytrium salamandrivorans]KAH9273295.1 hypothetical protein BASA83_004292 [Batrachochytrium salamandrivorans]